MAQPVADPNDDDSRWYAARTKPRQETTAVEHLRRQNFEVYFPQIRIERAVRGRITIVREPLFPGYLLIKFALVDATWRCINSTRGVANLLMFSENGRPSPMPNGEVENIQLREKQGKLFISEIQRLHRGDRVKFKIGPATDRIGRVIFTRGERVELLLNLLGQQIRVKAPAHVLEIVGPRTYKQ